MKQLMAFLLLLSSFFTVFFTVNKSFARDDWQQMREALQNMKQELMIRQLQQKEEELRQLVNSCSPLNEEYASGIAAEVIRGRYISAFELCREQEKNVDVCIQKIQEIRRKWKERCQGVAGMGLVDYYYTKAMMVVDEIQNYLKNSRLRVLRDAGGRGYETAVLSGASKAISDIYPGSVFSLITGTGKMVIEAGEIHFQGWNFVQFDMKVKGGMIVQFFPNKINYVNGKYNVAFYFDPKTKEWEVVEVNLPFDAQTEKLLMSLGQGVRVLDKEIIYIMNDFLHNTAFGVDLYVTSEELLLKNNSRKLVIESLFEYFAFDNYIAKIKAEAKRQEKQQQQQQGGEQSGKPRKKK